MNIELIRDIFTDNETLGKIRINGKFFCYSLEDTTRDIDDKKVYGKTAIPTGTYVVQLTYSNRFKRIMPLLLNVPGFAGVRIHAGNSHVDTEGCILVGYARTQTTISTSRAAYGDLMTRMRRAIQNNENISITIS